MKNGRTRILVLYSILSRVFALVLAWLASSGLRDGYQRNTIVLGSDAVGKIWHDILSPFVQWDGNHFLNIALRGYDSILSHAFFPGLPMVMRCLGWPLHMLGLPIEAAFSAAGLIFVQVSFVIGCVGLYKLTWHYFGSETIAFRTTLSFVFTSANIFMSALYTESPFAMLTFWGMYFTLAQGRIFTGSLFFASAGMFRSNGILGVLFIGYAAFRKGEICKGVIGCCFAVLPYILYGWWSKNLFCMNSTPVPDWCSQSSIYEYIQDTFWGVGFLKYWTLQHSGQILLMLPTLFVAVMGVYGWASQGIWCIRSGDLQGFSKWFRTSEKFLPFIAQMGLLTLFTVFFANCQILTRILTSCPIYFWSVERLTRGDGWVAQSVMGLHLAYFLVGPLVFSSGWNWT